LIGTIHDRWRGAAIAGRIGVAEREVFPEAPKIVYVEYGRCGRSVAVGGDSNIVNEKA
jgi:hypothetical protein